MKNTFNNVYVELIQRVSSEPPKDFTKTAKYRMFNRVSAMNNYFISTVIIDLNKRL